MRQRFFTAVAVATIVAAAQAQSPRGSVQVDAGFPGPSTGPTLGSDGDLVALAFVDTGGTDGVFVSTSDGRGLTWSTPVRVDTDSTGATKLSGFRFGNHTLAVSGTNIYVTWRDQRNGQDDVYFGRSTDSGATWTEARIDDGFPAGVNDVSDWTMAFTPDVAGDHIYVLTMVDNSGPEQVRVTASHDGGLTWSPSALVSDAGGIGDIDDAGMSSEGLTVHVGYDDDRAGSTSLRDLYYRRSTDGGVTWDAEIRIDSSGDLTGDVSNDVIVSSEGSLVAIAWQEELTSTSNEEIRVAVSTDGGTSFAADTLVGGYVAGTDDCDFTECKVIGGNIYAAWRDNRTGSDIVYIATSADSGATWSEAAVSTAGGSFMRIAGEGSNVAACWTDSNFPNVSEGALTTDGGTTWTGSIVNSDNTGDVDFAELEYNSLYGNFVHAWLSDDISTNNLFAGGYRPQTLTPNGFTGGPTSVNFDLSKFNGTDAFGLVIASASPGTFPLLAFGDSRDLGLTFDALFNLSISNPTLFLTTISGTGSGSTTAFNVDLNSIQIYAAAVSFDLGLNVGEITDAILIDIP